MDHSHIRHSTPFADVRLLEFALAAPSNFKVNQGWRRYMVRAGLEGILPKKIQWRKTKDHFSPDYKLRFNQQRAEIQSFLKNLQPS
ncbi:asparagine synthase-related protein, partial [Acaryochloris thomasi]